MLWKLTNAVVGVYYVLGLFALSYVNRSPTLVSTVFVSLVIIGATTGVVFASDDKTPNPIGVFASRAAIMLSMIPLLIMVFDGNAALVASLWSAGVFVALGLISQWGKEHYSEFASTVFIPMYAAGATAYAGIGWLAPISIITFMVFANLFAMSGTKSHRLTSAAIGGTIIWLSAAVTLSLL